MNTHKQKVCYTIIENVSLQNISDETNDFSPVPASTFRNEVIRNVACGYRCSFFLTESDHLYACGQNSSGELGWGEKTEEYQKLARDKTIIPSYGMIDYILSGDTFTFFVMKGKTSIMPDLVIELIFIDGTFLRCGSNGEGYIGAGAEPYLDTPAPVKNPPWKNNRVDKISFGYYHSVVLSNNSLYHTGKVPGQGHISNMYETIIPSQAKIMGKVVDVACGVFNILCINGMFVTFEIMRIYYILKIKENFLELDKQQIMQNRMYGLK